MMAGYSIVVDKNEAITSLTPRSLTLASGLLPTSNRCILDFANAPSKSLTSLGTSDVPRTFVVAYKGGA